MDSLRIEIVCTGNELLDGSVVDTNTQRLALHLKPLGHRIDRVTVVPDQRLDISEAIVHASHRSQVIIVSGGLGPTSDDVTLETASHALGRDLVFSREAKENVVRRLKKLGRRFTNKSQEKQFYIPLGAQVLRNEKGTAPGIQLNLPQATIFFLPGVPSEFDHLLETALLPWFRARRGERGEYLFELKTFGWAESELNELMKAQRLPMGVSLGFRTRSPENHLKFQVLARNRMQAERQVKPYLKRLTDRLERDGMAWSGGSFEEECLRRLLQQKVRVAIAESCTGGLIASMLTRVSGSSRVVDRGFVTYSNESKTDLLGVKPETLAKYGAVSEETAREMAEGALCRSQAERAVAVTGVAGPTGGTKMKPVGTVWIAVAEKTKVKTQKLSLSFDRRLNQAMSAYEALWSLVKGIS